MTFLKMYNEVINYNRQLLNDFMQQLTNSQPGQSVLVSQQVKNELIRIIQEAKQIINTELTGRLSKEWQIVGQWMQQYRSQMIGLYNSLAIGSNPPYLIKSNLSGSTQIVGQKLQTSPEIYNSMRYLSAIKILEPEINQIGDNISGYEKNILKTHLPLIGYLVRHI